MRAKRESLPTDIHLWRWSFRGLFPDGTKVTFNGTVEAPNERMGNTACDRVNEMMRRKYPEARWMHGREVETDTMKFGPTVQRGKFLREAEMVAKAVGSEVASE